MKQQLLNIQKLNTKYGKINRVTHFKYLGEILAPTGGEKIAQKTRLSKMKRAYGLTHNIYNKKCMSIHTKIRHYNTVFKPQALYASETLTILTKSDMENILKEERKIIRKILGPKRTEEGYRLHSRKTAQQKLLN
ncbi:hypothetical protein WA026_005839 [Henosepilachna vigintioctopunctata]|uniref:Ribosomal protein S13 n=1 Tax=Henosepilachna vigintioctopunctata TaxID=420089 RepID=A0AAW1TXN1_9CUCU